MSKKEIKQMIGKVFTDVADAMETGQFGTKIRVGLTLLGSEHGVENMVRGAELAQKRNPNIEVVLIGPKGKSYLKTVEASTEDDQHREMEALLDAGEIDGAVTMHYNFPIGVSTVGRVTTPGQGKEMFIATTTGTSSPHRVEAMTKNGLYGIITAKAMGIETPTVGILNVDGARQVERALKQLQSKGFEIAFADSMRADGGCIMRGNDLLTATPDVMITDTLTGNLLMKMFSSYTTGGSYEAMGFGYGPGIGEDYNRTILILSRASGVPVVANALDYAADLAKGKVLGVAEAEHTKAKKAGWHDILGELTKDKKGHKDIVEEIKAPAKEIVTASVSGIDIMDLEDAVQVLWKNDIYAESGMGCTGPIVMVSEDNLKKAMKILFEADYTTQQTAPC